ncbi:hypothetical protein GDO86_020072, partial [Hymenochirus boettgeri]
MLQCLQDKKIPCQNLQEVLQGVGEQDPNMAISNGKDLYPVIKSFLMPSQNLGNACSQNINSSTWIKQTLGKFAQFAEYKDFVDLFPNFNALDALTSLTVPQIVAFSLESGSGSNSNSVGQIMGTLQRPGDVQNFLSSFNSAAKNVSSLPSPLAQGLLNKTLQVLIPNLSTSNSSDWSALFQNNLNLVLPEITPGQLNFLPLNISCDSFQAVVKGMDAQINNLKNVKPEDIFKVVIKPYLSQKVTTCPQNIGSGAWIQQNLGRYSKSATYNDLVSMNPNFNGVDALSNLTQQQIVSFCLESSVGNDPKGVSAIVGLYPDPNDITNFLAQINTAADS